MAETQKHRLTKKAGKLLAEYEAPLIKEMGATAFDLLSPRQVALELGIDVPRVTDLVREGWLEGVPGHDVGHAHQYHRWRVEFVRRHRGQRKKIS